MGYLNGFISNNNQLLIQVSIAKVNSKPEEFRSYNALIDTGAQRSHLSKKAIGELNLVKHGEAPITSASDTTMCGLYYIDLLIHTSPKSISGSCFEMIEFSQNPNFDIILGMDIILQGSLHISSDRHFTISIL